MHGDDVASAGVTVTTDVISKATEAFLELLKVEIEKKRYADRSSGAQSKVLSGGEVTYRRLKEGGEITTLPNFPNEDYGEFLKRAKKADIPVAAIQEQGKENSLTLCINEKDKPAVNAIIKDIIQEKLRQPEQTERIEKRIDDLGKLIRKVYEDRVLGNLPDKTCAELLADYQQEKETLQAELDELLKRSETMAQDEADVDEYIRRLKSYAGVDTLTRQMAMDLLEYVTVDRYEGEGKPRNIHIYYKLIDKPLRDKNNALA